MSSKSKPQKKRQTRSKRRNSRGNGLGQSISTAPTAVSGSLNQFTRILPSKRSDGVRVHLCIPFGTASETSGIQAGVTVGTLAPNNVSYVAFGPDSVIGRNPGVTTTTSNIWVNPVLARLASIFARYKMNSFKFHYLAQQITTQPGNFVFAFSSDPAASRIWKFNTDLFTYQDALALPDSMPYAPWRSFTFDLSGRIDKKQEYYTNLEVIATNTTDEDYTANRAVLRQSCWGAAIIMKSAPAGASLTHGVFYVEVDMDFYQWMTNSDTSPGIVSGGGESGRIIPRFRGRIDDSLIQLRDDKKKVESSSSSTLATKVKETFVPAIDCACAKSERVPIEATIGGNQDIWFERCMKCGRSYRLEVSSEGKEVKMDCT